MSEPFDAHAHFEQLAEQLIHFHEQLRKVVEHVGDDDIRTLIAECRREAHPQPGDSHNFEMPDWDGIANQLESELHYRRFFRRAAEHEAATGIQDVLSALRRRLHAGAHRGDGRRLGQHTRQRRVRVYELPDQGTQEAAREGAGSHRCERSCGGRYGRYRARRR